VFIEVAGKWLNTIIQTIYGRFAPLSVCPLDVSPACLSINMGKWHGIEIYRRKGCILSSGFDWIEQCFVPANTYSIGYMGDGF